MAGEKYSRKKINSKSLKVAPIGLDNQRIISDEQLSFYQLELGTSQGVGIIVKWATIRITVATKVALHTDGAERRWVRQAVMGVLRWRDLPGTRSSTNGTVRSISTIEVNWKCQGFDTWRIMDEEVNQRQCGKIIIIYFSLSDVGCWYENKSLPRTEFSTWLNKINICRAKGAHLKPPTIFFVFFFWVSSFQCKCLRIYQAPSYMAALGSGMNGNVTSL